MDPDLRRMGDAQILADFRERCGTVSHPVGTCRMGLDAQAAVVSPRMKVQGVQGLRVVDASVFSQSDLGQHQRTDHDAGAPRR